MRKKILQYLKLSDFILYIEVAAGFNLRFYYLMNIR